MNFDRWAASTLFSEESLRQWLMARDEHARERVEAWEEDAVRFAPETVARLIASEYEVGPLGFDWDEEYRLSDIEEFKVDVLDDFQTGRTVSRYRKRIRLGVSVTGELELLRYKASRSSSRAIKASVYSTESAISYVYEASSMTLESIEEFRAANRAEIQQRCDWTNADTAEWTQGLQDRLLPLVEQRKERLDQRAELQASLTLPLRSATPSRRISVPISRRPIPFHENLEVTDRATTHVLDESAYEEMVEMIRHVGNTVERLPGTASKFQEEEWRDLLLFILNANFEGGVTGEAFNGQGKTDILLRHEDRNVFIGECKVWRGSKAFGEALDQLLGYTVWRDSKAALVLFIRQADPSAVVEKALTVLREHQHFVTEKPSRDSASRSDFLVRSAVDPDRTISVAFLPVVVGHAGGALAEDNDGARE